MGAALIDDLSTLQHNSSSFVLLTWYAGILMCRFGIYLFPPAVRDIALA